MSKEQILTVEEVGSILKVNERTVRKLLKDGHLKGYKKLGKWYILYLDVVEYIKS